MQQHLNEMAAPLNHHGSGLQSSNPQYDQDGCNDTDPIQPPSSVSNSSIRHSNSNFGFNLPIVNDVATNAHQITMTNNSGQAFVPSGGPTASNKGYSNFSNMDS